MTRFHLVRHADKDCDPDLLTGRAKGVSLSALGRRQAEQLAEELSSLRLVRILSSPMERARETATPLARRVGLEIETCDGLTEMDIGDWTNRRCSELEALPLWREFNARRSTTRAPGGETMQEVQERFMAELRRVHEEVPDGEIVVISHADPIKAVLLQVLGASLDFWWRITISPASISTVEIEGDRAVVLRMNLQLRDLGGRPRSLETAGGLNVQDGGIAPLLSWPRREHRGTAPAPSLHT